MPIERVNKGIPGGSAASFAESLRLSETLGPFGEAAPFVFKGIAGFELMAAGKPEAFRKGDGIAATTIPILRCATIRAFLQT